MTTKSIEQALEQARTKSKNQKTVFSVVKKNGLFYLENTLLPFIEKAKGDELTAIFNRGIKIVG